jgi:hypothetical protein
MGREKSAENEESAGMGTKLWESAGELAQDGGGVRRAARRFLEILCCLAVRFRTRCAFERAEGEKVDEEMAKPGEFFPPIKYKGSAEK